MLTPQTYEEEYNYWPWGELIKTTADWLEENAPIGAHILDYMCGTGYLLNEVGIRRGDLKLSACSIRRSFVEYAKQNYRALSVVCQDLFDYRPLSPPDIIVCTGGLHHLKREQQPAFIEKVASELCSGGHFLLGEELIRPFATHIQRRESVDELFQSILSYVVSQDPPKEIVEEVKDVWEADLKEHGEYKCSLEMITNMLEQYFFTVDTVHVWPKEHVPFGDFLLICCRK